MCSPAARVTDFHACPVTTGAGPHVGGPIFLGTPTVLIGNLPAARAGDLALCMGSLDGIQAGAATVLINNMPAARMGDPTFHGGTVVGGFPTVLIGGATAAVPKPEGIPRPDKRFRIRILKGESESAMVPVPRVPFLQVGGRKSTITFQILDTETNLQAEFVFDWKYFGPEVAVPGNKERPGSGPGPGPWKDFTAPPGMRLEEFDGDVLLRSYPFDDEMDLHFADDDSRGVNNQGAIKGIEPGADFDPDARPGIIDGIDTLDYQKDTLGPYKGN